MSTFACRHDILYSTESVRSVEQGEECGQSTVVKKAKRELGGFEARRDFWRRKKKRSLFPFPCSFSRPADRRHLNATNANVDTMYIVLYVEQYVVILVTIRRGKGTPFSPR